DPAGDRRAETAVAPVVRTRDPEGPQEHTERLLPMAAELLAQAGLQASDLHAVASGQGPGGFTGRRGACGVAQGMALALEAPVLPVVSHLAVAEQVDRKSTRLNSSHVKISYA